MQNQAVRNLVLSLTSDDAFVEEMRQQHFPKNKILSPFKRMVYPMRNPRFAFDFVDTYARAEQLLPRKSVAPQCGHWHPTGRQNVREPANFRGKSGLT